MTLLEMVANGRWQPLTSDYKLSGEDTLAINGVSSRIKHATWSSHSLIDDFFNRSAAGPNLTEVPLMAGGSADYSRRAGSEEGHGSASQGYFEGSSATAASSDTDVTLWPSGRLSEWVLGLTRSAAAEGLLSERESRFARHFFCGRRFRTSYVLHDRLALAHDVCSTIAARRRQSPDALAALEAAERDLHFRRTEPLPGRIRAAIEELLALLRRPAVRQLLLTHDLVQDRLQASFAARAEPLEAALTRLPVSKAPNYEPEAVEDSGRLPSIQREGQHRLVMVRRDDKPLGATIRNEGDKVVVARVLQGGRIHQADLMREGDEIIAINGVSMRGQDIERVCRLLNEMPGILLFRTMPNPSAPRPVSLASRKAEFFVRALFNYCAQTDRFMPCRELGLSFNRGEVLGIVDRVDPDWWQAFSLADIPPRLAPQAVCDSLPGLVPSPGFQVRRYRFSSPEEELMAAESSGTLPSRCSSAPSSAMPPSNSLLRRFLDKKGRRRERGVRVRCKSATFGSEADYDDPPVPTYEAIVTLDPASLPYRRPIAVVSVDGFGTDRLIDRLVYASRGRLCGLPYLSTLPGYDRCLSPNEFHRLRAEGLLLDCHVRERHHFAFHWDTLVNRMRSGKTVVFKIPAGDIRRLRCAKLKPYFVFLTPPTDHRELRELRRLAYDLSPDEMEPVAILEDILTESDAIDADFGYFFDTTLPFSQISEVIDELYAIVAKVETEVQWIPAKWMTKAESEL